MVWLHLYHLKPSELTGRKLGDVRHAERRKGRHFQVGSTIQHNKGPLKQELSQEAPGSPTPRRTLGSVISVKLLAEVQGRGADGGTFPFPLLCSLCLLCPPGLPDGDPKLSVPSWLEDSTVKGSWADTER